MTCLYMGNKTRSWFGIAALLMACTNPAEPVAIHRASLLPTLAPDAARPMYCTMRNVWVKINVNGVIFVEILTILEC